MQIRIVFRGIARPNLFTQCDAVPREGDYLHLEGQATYLIMDVTWRGSAHESPPGKGLHEVSLWVEKAT